MHIMIIIIYIKRGDCCEQEIYYSFAADAEHFGADG